MSKFIERRRRERLIKKDTVVLYHHNCSDGFGGAWAAWKKFGNKAEYIGVRHQIPPPPGLKNKIIYMIDFTYPLPITKKLIKENRQVTAIDHHISAKDATLLTYQCSYALNNSGSVLSWKYFHPKKAVPKLLQYVEDMDLWRFKIPYTKAIFAYLDLFPFDFKVWSKLAIDLEKPSARKQFIEKGKLLAEYEQKLIGRLIGNNAQEARFGGYAVRVINSPLFDSEIGNALTNASFPMGIVWYQGKDGGVKVGLRSKDAVDVAKIAQRYGGGGHKTSAGFKLPPGTKFPWKIL